MRKDFTETNWRTLVPTQPSWLAGNTILFAQTGSHAYGTATAASDNDFSGIVIPPPSYFLGLDTFGGYDKSGGKAHKNTTIDTDVKLTHINQFVRDAMKGSPSSLEMLFLEADDYLRLTSEGKELLSIRKRFLSKRTFHRYSGYARAHTKKLQEGKGEATRIAQYGYDTKLYMHAVRIYNTGIEILRHKTLTVRTPHAAFLLTLRDGLHEYAEAMENLAVLDTELQVAYERSCLPEESDSAFINRWLTQFNHAFLTKRK